MANPPPIIVQSTDAPLPRKPTIKHGKKPPECTVCCFRDTGYGFAKDWVGATPKAAFMFAAPSKDDVVEGVALGSDWGSYILANYIYPAGFKKSEVILANVLRCYPPFDVRYHRPGYPTGQLKVKAEATCRNYDVLSVGKFDPNLFLITFDPHDAMKTPAYRRQIQVDLSKLKTFISAGFRPLTLFGNEAAGIFTQGYSAKTFRGHFFETDYKYKGKI